MKTGRSEGDNDAVAIRKTKIVAMVFLGWVSMRCTTALAAVGKDNSYRKGQRQLNCNRENWDTGVTAAVSGSLKVWQAKTQQRKEQLAMYQL